jgi:hypothetical protein
MLITPDTTKMLRAEALHWDSSGLTSPELATVVAACDEALASGGTGAAARACRDAIDRWRATDVSELSLFQVEDLWRFAVSADDWHAARICSAAAHPMHMCWTPSATEVAAMRACVHAWSDRAARLRVEGILPWPPRVARTWVAG